MNADLQVFETLVANLWEKVTGERHGANVAVHVASPAGAPIFVAPADSTLVHSAPAIAAVVSAVPTRPLRLRGRNVAAALRYYMVFDAAALPVANGTAPDWAIMPVPAGALFSDVWDPTLTAVGCVWYCSSTDVTLTAAVANDMEVDFWHRP